MRVIFLAVLALSALPVTARADASLSALGGQDVTEGAYALSIEVHGLYATVEARQTFVNGAKNDAAAVYLFDLPETAVVDGVTAALPGRRPDAGIGADAVAAATPSPTDDPDGAIPDRALLQVIDHRPADPAAGLPPMATYELRVFPVPAGGSVTVTTRWVTPLEVADGRVVLRLPDRGADPRLSREVGTVRFRPVPGIAAFDHVHVDGLEVARAARAGAISFAHTLRGNLVVDAVPRVRGHDPLVWAEPLPIDGRRGAVALSMLVPRPAATTGRLPFDRVLVLVDASRSMDGTIDAAARVTDAVLAAAPPSARVQTLLFDRTVHAVGGWRAGDAATRAAVGKAIRSNKLANGTQLDEAFSAAGTALGAPDAKTLVVVVTDGLVPIDATADELLHRLGGVHVDVRVSFVLVAPDHAALPDVLHGPLAEIADRTGGMVVVTRASEAAARAPALAVQLGNPAPVHDLAVDGGASVTGLSLPEVVPAGSGAVAFGWYQGARPGRITLTATRASHPLRIAARRAPAPRLVDLALARVEGADLVGAGDPSAAGGLTPEADVDALIDRQRRRRGLVTENTSLVVIDRAAPFAAERAKLAVGGGPFTRIPAPGESHGRRVVAPHVRIGTARLRGELDARLIRRMIELGLVPRARTCFQPLLLKPKKSEGTVRLDLELSRGEVVEVRVAPGSDFGTDVHRCLVEAAYQLDVPKTALDGLPDPVYLVHYPITFRSLAADEIILPGDADSDDPIDPGVHVDADQPLGDHPPHP